MKAHLITRPVTWTYPGGTPGVGREVLLEHPPLVCTKNGSMKEEKELTKTKTKRSEGMASCEGQRPWQTVPMCFGEQLHIPRSTDIPV